MIKRPISKQPIPKDATKVFKGKIFDVYQWQQKMFDGNFITFEKVKRPDTVLVFPILDDGKILIAEEEQPGSEWVTHAIGGRMEENEDPEMCARREMLEETGFEADKFILWKAVYPDIKIDRVIYFFIAKNLKKASDKFLDNGEKIILKSISFDELVDLAYNEKFEDKDIIPDLLKTLIDQNRKKDLEKLFKSLN